MFLHHIFLFGAIVIMASSSANGQQYFIAGRPHLLLIPQQGGHRFPVIVAQKPAAASLNATTTTTPAPSSSSMDACLEMPLIQSQCSELCNTVQFTDKYACQLAVGKEMQSCQCGLYRPPKEEPTTTTTTTTTAKPVVAADVSVNPCADPTSKYSCIQKCRSVKFSSQYVCEVRPLRLDAKSHRCNCILYLPY